MQTSSFGRVSANRLAPFLLQYTKRDLVALILFSELETRAGGVCTAFAHLSPNSTRDLDRAESQASLLER